VYAIAQSADGYLWIGTDQGLVRFDGASFRLLDSKRAPTLPPGRVLGLLADHQNNLWIRFATEGLFRYRSGSIADVIAGQEDRLIEMMYRRADGTSIFQSTWTTLFKFDPGTDKVTRLGVRIRPVVTAPVETADGTLWLGTRDDGLVYLKNGQEGIQKTASASGRINCLAPDDGRGLWIGTDDGVQHWDGANGSKRDVPVAIRNLQTLSMIRDGEGNLWIGTSKGLLRMVGGVVTALDSERHPQSVNVTFEDREGNIWFGGSQGLERLHEKPFVTYSMKPPGENVAENDGPLWADPAGRLWFAPSTGGLYWRRADSLKHIENQSLDNDVVYSIAGGPNDLWVGRQSGGLTRLSLQDPHSTQTYTAREGLAAGSVYCVHRSRDGTVWAGTIGGGVSRLIDGHFETYTAANGLASNSVSAIEEGADGTMWFATTGGLSAFSGKRWHTYTSADGLPPRDIISLAADGPILWIGTSGGLAMLRDGHVVSLNDAPAVLHEAILGIAIAHAQEEHSASIWIATAQSVLRVNRDRLLAGKVDVGDVRVFDGADGLLGTENLKRFRSVITDDLGRIWFSTNRGLAVVDPTAVANQSLPVIVHVQTVTADERTLGEGDSVEGGKRIRFPAAPHRVVFGYVGLNLGDPARVLFRYWLVGYDTTWSNPTPLREATYTNLSPGPYRFRVMARNSAGAWNPVEADTAISITPLFWQTWWFAGVAIFALGAGAIYWFRVRTHKLTAGLSLRFEERLAERTRIARDLHDSLLQNLAGISLQLDGVSKQVASAPTDATELIQDVREQVDACFRDARTKVWDLRTPVLAEQGLVPALEEVLARVEPTTSARCELSVSGDPRPGSPEEEEELLHIAQEAINNAIQHAQPESIRVGLEYAERSLTLRVSDDGVGFNPAASFKSGHWGLKNMAERAEQIRAKCKITSVSGKGTEVAVRVPFGWRLRSSSVAKTDSRSNRR
jgi:signal transduction histidine kinase/ligand-binding sensor domain-containing protein